MDFYPYHQNFEQLKAGLWTIQTGKLFSEKHHKIETGPQSLGFKVKILFS